jgi:metal-responsive CopG/Arc/MetJ family transcriptional regulator
MKTVQMTLDEDLVQAVDRVSKQLHTSRSAFTRKALREALARYSLEQLERKHRQGYEGHPVGADEFSVWETEQAWGDE